MARSPKFANTNALWSALGVRTLSRLALRHVVISPGSRSTPLAYAFAEPLAGLLEQKVEESGKELQCIKTTLLASMQGYNPSTAIEFGRKVLFSTERPSFAELENHVRGKK